MSSQPRLYSVLPSVPSAPLVCMDAFVSALWSTVFPGRSKVGPNHVLEENFAMMSVWPEEATRLICPYYFDQVTYNLPSRDQVKHMGNYNLQLQWCRSWADLETERQRRPRTREVRPNTGIHLTRLCQLQCDCSPSSHQYAYLMYGC